VRAVATDARNAGQRREVVVIDRRGRQSSRAAGRPCASAGCVARGGTGMALALGWPVF
jgi:hypothetical protein